MPPNYSAARLELFLYTLSLIFKSPPAADFVMAKNHIEDMKCRIEENFVKKIAIKKRLKTHPV